MTEDTNPSSHLTRRKVLLGGLLVAAAGVAFARQPDQTVDYLGNNELENIIPKSIGDWEFITSSGLVVPPEDQLSRAIYSQLLTRAYSDGTNPPIMLLVAQSSSQTGILQIHRPEVCYTAGGYQLSGIERHRIDLPTSPVEAVSLTATNGPRIEHIVYWTRIGDHMPASWREQRLAVARDNLDGKIPDAVMVRVSTFGTNEAEAKAQLDGFVKALMQSLKPGARKVLAA